MRKYEKEYLEWLATNPICACGCGESMTSSFASFVSAMKLYGRPPLTKARHDNKRRPRKFKEEYDEWLKTDRICKCGCGQKIEWDYSSFKSYYAQKLKFPEYEVGHGWYLDDLSAPVKVVNFNGCRISIMRKNIRCKEYETCSHYLDCLEFVIVEHKGYGWEKVCLT